jgi:hypothetical protein
LKKNQAGLPAVIETLTPAELVAGPAAVREYRSEFSFGKLTKQTRNVRTIQARIESELYLDSTEGIERLAHQVLRGVRKLVRGKEQTLAQLFSDETKVLAEVCMMLGGLRMECSNNYQQIAAFRSRSNSRLQQMYKQRPGLSQDAGHAREQYLEMAKRFSTLRKTDPQYYEVRERLAQLRDNAQHNSHNVHMIDSTADFVDDIATKVDVVSQLLLRGKEFSERLSVQYSLAGECLKEIGTGASLVREIFRNSGELYELMQRVSVAYQQAEAVHAEFENPHILTRAYRAMPALPANLSTGGVIDYLNSKVRSAARLLK